MNTNFKVVFNKARGALMVANEITSSVQAKGTKTVVAAAVAAVMAGVAGTAMAADGDTSAAVAPAASVAIEGTLNVAAKETETVYSTDGTVKVTSDDGQTHAWGEKDSLDSGSSVVLKGGNLSVAANLTVKDLQDGATGTLVINQADFAENVGSTDDRTFGKLDMNFTVLDATSQKNASLTLKGSGATSFSEGVMTVVKAEGSKGDTLGTASLIAEGNLNFGVAKEVTDHGTVVPGTGSSYDFNVAAKTEVKSTSGSIAYNQGKLTTSDAFTMESTSGNVTIGENVSFANTGVVTLSGTAVNLEADYATGEGNTGKLILAGTTNNIIGDVTTDSIKIGSVAAKIADEKNTVILKGANVVSGAKVETAALVFASTDPLNVSGSDLKATTTTVAATGAVMNVAVEGSGVNAKYATVDLGDVTVATDKTSNFGLTVTNDSDKNSLKAASLTIAATDNENTKAGSFTLSQGGMSVGSLTNNKSGSVTVAKDSNKAKLTLTADSTNAGTLALGASGNLVVSEGATLTNTGTIGGTLATPSGTLTVSGTVINNETGKLYADTLVVNGKLETAVITTDEKPVTVFHFDTITLNEKGVIKVNGKDADVARFYKEEDGKATLTIGDGTWNLNGGTIEVNDKGNVVTANADVVAGSTSGDLELNIAGTYEVGNVSIADKAQKVTLTAKKGANLSAKKVTFSGQDNTITVGEGAVVSATELSLTSGAATTITGGTLIVTDKLTLKDGTGAVLTVSDDGDLNATLKALGVKIGDTVTVGSDIKDAAIHLDADSALTVTDDLSEVTLETADVKKLTAKLDAASKGIVDLGALTIKNLVSDKGEAKYSDVKTLNGVTTEALKAAKVTGVNEKLTHSQSWGAIALGGSDKEVKVEGAVLTLNGNGQLVTYDTVSGNTTTTHLADVKLSGADAGFIVDGTGAETATIGKVYSDNGGTDGFFTVAGTRDVTVEGDVKIGELEVEKDAKLTVVQSKNEGTEAPAVEVSNLQVAGNFEAAASKVVVKNTNAKYYDANQTNPINDQIAQVTGTATVKDLEVAGDFLVTGTATVTGDLTTAATVYVGNNEAAGTMIVGNLASGSVFADPAWDVEGVAHSKLAVKTAAENTTVEAGRNSIVSLGTTDVSEAETLFAKSGYVLADTPLEDDEANGVKGVSAIDTHTVNSVLYVNGGKTVAEGGAVSYATYLGNAIAGNDTIEQHGSYLHTDIYVAKNSMLAIDLNTVDTTGETAVFDKDVVLEHDSILFLDNAANGNQVKLSAGELSMDGAEAVFEGDLLMEVVSVEGAGNEGKFGIQMQNKDDLAKYEMANLAGFDAVYGMFEEGKNLNNNSSSAQFAKWLYSTTTSPVWQQFSDGSYDVNLADLKKITTDVASLGASTGVQTLTMDAVNQMADTVATRNSILTQRAQGVNVWADVNGGKFEAKKLFDGAGYSSDIYSGVLGLDYQFSCNAVLGAALTIGTADTDSKNSGVAASTDTDLVGFSVYASKTFADIWNIAADIGYMSASNDVKANGYDHAWKFSQDTDAFTVGVRGEVLTKAGAVNIVPHVGLRYTQLSTDGFEAGYVTDIDDQNIFQMPVGVALSADFETNGWTLAPKFDLSVVPTFGDKDADLKLGINGVSATDDLSVRVIDSNPVQATLGINATNGDWGFGLSYKLGVGSDERMNNSFNAQVRYAF